MSVLAFCEKLRHAIFGPGYTGKMFDFLSVSRYSGFYFFLFNQTIIQGIIKVLLKHV